MDNKQLSRRSFLKSIHSVSLVRFAAHGYAEREEIAHILQVRPRTKLVVLSYCQSACRQITAEGVVGIPCAFLGSSARLVLVTLWAIEDRARKQFLSRFYEHLVGGESG